MSKNEAINNLAWIIINSAGQGYVAENDLEYANECLDKLIAAQQPRAADEAKVRRVHNHVFIKEVCSCGMTVARFTANA